MSFDRMWNALLPLGRDEATGGYHRSVWTRAERACREWFVDEAGRRGLETSTDGNGNLWAWLGTPDDRTPAVVTGSHLDSVPAGGAYDGPLGVVSAFAALDRLQEQGVPLTRPLGIVAFADEEGARFGVACAGSRLLTGLLDPDQARGLTDRDGTTYAEAMARAGHDPERVGKDEQLLRRIGTYVELHIEQGRGLADLGHPVALGDAMWAHGRWRFDFEGRPDHAGTTRMEDRKDPMLTYAMTALAANKRARLAPSPGARATFGRVEVQPNSTNGIPARVRAWLDARAPDEPAVDALVGQIEQQATERAGRDGTEVTVEVESLTRAVDFDPDLRERLARRLGDPPVLSTQAGHDAGVLAVAGVPTAMLYVRNPSGVSHAPEEYAEPADCLAGVEALAAVLGALQ